MTEPHPAIQLNRKLNGTMSNDSAIPKSVHIFQIPVDRIDDFGSSDSDKETSDFDDAASVEYWPADEDLSTAEKEEQELTENILMTEMLAAEQARMAVSLLVEKAELTMGASFTPDDMAAVCAQLSLDKSGTSAWSTFNAMIAELVEKDLDLVDWLTVAGAADLVASFAVDNYLNGLTDTEWFQIQQDHKGEVMWATPKDAAHAKQVQDQALKLKAAQQWSQMQQWAVSPVQESDFDDLGDLDEPQDLSTAVNQTLNKKAAIAFAAHLPKVDISGVSAQSRCPFCWSDLCTEKEDCKVPVKTPCVHVFGRQCLPESIKEMGQLCPVCR